MKPVLALAVLFWAVSGYSQTAPPRTMELFFSTTAMAKVNVAMMPARESALPIEDIISYEAICNPVTNATGYIVTYWSDGGNGMHVTTSFTENGPIYFTNEYGRPYVQFTATNRVGESAESEVGTILPWPSDRVSFGDLTGKEPRFMYRTGSVGGAWISTNVTTTATVKFGSNPSFFVRRPLGITNQWFCNYFNPRNGP